MFRVGHVIAHYNEGLALRTFSISLSLVRGESLHESVAHRLADFSPHRGPRLLGAGIIARQRLIVVPAMRAANVGLVVVVIGAHPRRWLVDVANYDLLAPRHWSVETTPDTNWFVIVLEICVTIPGRHSHTRHRRFLIVVPIRRSSDALDFLAELLLVEHFLLAKSLLASIALHAAAAAATGVRQLDGSGESSKDDEDGRQRGDTRSSRPAATRARFSRMHNFLSWRQLSSKTVSESFACAKLLVVKGKVGKGRRRVLCDCVQKGANLSQSFFALWGAFVFVSGRVFLSGGPKWISRVFGRLVKVLSGW